MELRGLLGAALVPFLLAGCATADPHGRFEATACDKEAHPTHGALRVQLPVHYAYQPGDGLHETFGGTTAGKCVELSRDDGSVVSSSRIDATGNATLALPEAGRFWVRWQEPWPHDKACAFAASDVIQVPGADALVLEVASMCY